MTVKEYAMNHRNTVLDMMTPSGFFAIPTNDLLTMDEVQMNPGCSGCNMPIESAVILEMTVIHICTDKDSVSMLVE